MSDINTKPIDFERAASLLRVVHDCAGVGPKLTNLGNAAMTELTKMNDAIKVAAQEAEKERLAKLEEQRAKMSVIDPATQQAIDRNNQRLQDADAVKRQQAIQQTDVLNPALVPDAPSPNEPDPDPELRNEVRPAVHPSDSQTATIADRRL